MKKISITHFGNKHSDWLRALDFYKQEINILRNRLTEIAGKNTAAEPAKQVEHFENQFKIQVDNIDRLSHDIRENVAETTSQAKGANAGYIDGHLFNRHESLEEAFSAEEKLVAEMRHEFNRFAAEWM